MERLSVIERHLRPVGVSPSSASLEKLLDGEVAIVTGSGQGIGRSTAEALASSGSRVVVTDIDKEKSDAVATSLNSRHGKGTALSFPGDVNDEGFAKAIAEKTVEVFGDITILVNNAGYTDDGVIHKTDDSKWERMLDIHLTAPFRLIRACGTFMRDEAKKVLLSGGKPKGRSIVNISSVSGTHGNAGQINYATAKMGVLGMTKTVAKEWGRFNIRCNCVAFGTILTRLVAPKTADNTIVVDGKEIRLGIPQTAKKPSFAHVPLGRAGRPEEAADAVLFLASPLSSYVNGQCLEVTGGSHL